jgi:hypothetical protein
MARTWRACVTGLTMDGEIVSVAVSLSGGALRAPLIVLISVYAISDAGLANVPRGDANGRRVPMSTFRAFYVTSCPATTIGCGELPSFTDAPLALGPRLRQPLAAAPAALPDRARDGHLGVLRRRTAARTRLSLARAASPRVDGRERRVEHPALH